MMTPPVDFAIAITLADGLCAITWVNAQSFSGRFPLAEFRFERLLFK